MSLFCFIVRLEINALLQVEYFALTCWLVVFDFSVVSLFVLLFLVELLSRVVDILVQL